MPGREQHGNLYTINADGGDLKQLTRYPSPKAVFSGSFSPDGQWITFAKFWGTDPYPAIFVMRANGADVRQVSPQGYNVAPDWGLPVTRSEPGSSRQIAAAAPSTASRSRSPSRSSVTFRLTQPVAQAKAALHRAAFRRRFRFRL